MARPLPGTSGRPSAGPPLRPQGDAERFLARIQAQLLDGSYIDPNAGQTTLAEYVTAWQKSQLHHPTTVMQVDAHLRNHVLRSFGDRPIASIRPSEMQAWVRSRSEVLAGTSAIQALRPQWAVKSAEDLREYADFQVVELGKGLGLYNKTVMKAFHGLLNKRHEAAHPSDYFPDMKETLGYVSEIFNRLERLK